MNEVQGRVEMKLVKREVCVVNHDGLAQEVGGVWISATRKLRKEKQRTKKKYHRSIYQNLYPQEMNYSQVVQIFAPAPSKVSNHFRSALTGADDLPSSTRYRR